MKKTTAKNKFNNWRSLWYSVMVWALAIFVSGFVILPWYYLVLPLVVFWTTVVYFKNGEKTFKRGIGIAFFWFAVVGVMDFLEIVGPNFKNALLYVSDFRNWLKYILILMVPVIYGLVQENRPVKKTLKRKLPIVLPSEA